MQARNFSILALLLAVLALMTSVEKGAGYSVPTSFAFQGYLVDSSGNPVTTSTTSAPLSMKFGIFINGTRVWYAAYSTVNVVAGSFTVNLGADNDIAQGLDPASGNPLPITGVTPITPSLLANVTDQTPVAVQIQVANGDGTYDTLTPNVPIDSALFALRTETIAGYSETQLAKQDGSGNILDANGNPVISSSGAWLGSGPGAPGIPGPPGQTGPQGPAGQGFNFAGPWIESEYSLYDVVTYDGSVWVAYGPDVPTGPPEQDPNWTQFAAGFGLQPGAWSNSGTYYADDVVLYNGSLYVALQTIPEPGAGAPPPPQDTADWQLFTQGLNPTGQFTSAPAAPYNPGDVAFYNGSSYVYRPAPDGPSATSSTPDVNRSWTLLASGGEAGIPGAVGAQGAAGPPTFAGARWVPLGMRAKLLTAFAGEPLLPVGAASASPQADAFYVQWLSRAGAKSTAGEVGPFDQTQSRYHPILTALVRTGSSIAEQRVWVALSSADLSQTDGVGSEAIRYVGLRYSTSAGDTDWQVASSDGTTGSVVDSGIPVEANTVYLVQLNWSIDGELTCLINNIDCATKTTNLDTGNPTDLGVDCVSTALGPAAVAQSMAYISLRYDGNNF